MQESSSSLEAHLSDVPIPLKFGTSGRRGEVIHLTQLEVYINALAELEYLISLPKTRGGIHRGEEFFFAYDLRPSSTRYVQEQGGRGEIAQAIERAIRDAGLTPVNLGAIPTPALTFHALERSKGSMMITGSHIPFDRNGYKTNSSAGELLKKDEGPIAELVETCRARLYAEPIAQSLFDHQGQFKCGHQQLSPASHAGSDGYLRRYADFFGDFSLKGKRVLVYEHSAVGRDLLVEVLNLFGAEVIPVGRSESFVPIDTENIDDEQLHTIQRLADDAMRNVDPLDAIVSTDGDSDRPLILSAGTGGIQFHGGDLVGMVTAEFLGTDAAVVPISCNDGIDKGPLRSFVEPKTRIGSPFVIAGMERARQKGKCVICGWEANGGFLTGSDICRSGKVLRALPTRDAFLPVLAVLCSAAEKNVPIRQLFTEFPPRFSRAGLLRKFPRPISLRILERFSPAEPTVKDVVFGGGETSFLDENGSALAGNEAEAGVMEAVREKLQAHFTPSAGFGLIVRLNYTDGIRMYFSNGDVAHVRPSGNADELRIYAVADSQERANEIVRLGVMESDGILRQLEKSVS